MTRLNRRTQNTLIDSVELHNYSKLVLLVDFMSSVQRNKLYWDIVQFVSFNEAIVEEIQLVQGLPYPTVTSFNYHTCHVYHRRS